MNLSAFYRMLVRFGPATPEFMLLKKTTFAAIWQKSVYNAKYLGIFWTDLYLLYRFGRHMSGMIILTFVWQLPKEHCHGNQLNLGAVRRRRQERPLLVALAFNNGFANGDDAFKRLNGNNPASSRTILVNFHPIIS